MSNPIRLYMSMSLDGFIAGRWTFELAGRWQGDDHDGVRRLEDRDVAHLRYRVRRSGETS